MIILGHHRIDLFVVKRKLGKTESLKILYHDCTFFSIIQIGILPIIPFNELLTMPSFVLF